MTSRRPPDVLVKIPNGIRKMPKRIKLRIGAQDGNGRKSMYDSRKNVVDCLPEELVTILVL